MAEQILKGIPASDGIAMGPAYVYAQPSLQVPARAADSAEHEFARFLSACEQAHAELQILYDSVKVRIGEKEAAIFEAHQMMLLDPTLRQKVRESVEAGEIVENAVIFNSNQLAEMLAGMSDELFAARAADVRDIGGRILRILLGHSDTSLKAVQEACIVVANDLSPSDTAGLDPNLTLGFVTAEGGLTSHSAILARTLGIPAIVGIGRSNLQPIATGMSLALDGKNGLLVIAPTQETIQIFQQRKLDNESVLETMKANTHKEARTRDGLRVEVSANIGDIASAQVAMNHGADGIGLLRTEFLYLEERQPPSEEKQYSTYREIFDVMAGCPIIVRTLDIGGDKPPSYLSFPNETNPFLGWRAIRISLDEPDLFKTQIRAILRAAVGHDVRMMFPMVSDLGELRGAREIVETVKKDLKAASVNFAEDIPVGIMVETPAAAVLVDVLAQEADFFSLGTNDLTQYTMAVDRGNAKVAALYQPLHPAVLRLIKQTIDAGHAKGKWVGMCGELAGMPKAIPILLGLRLDEFSMNPHAIPQAKHMIRNLTTDRAVEIANHVMSLATVAEIEDYMKQILDSLENTYS
jgi:phosphotransferase system enzyme I (PtsI)